MKYSNDETLDEKLRDISVMYELVSSIGTSLDLREETDRFLEKLLRRFGYEIGSIMIRDIKDENLFIIVSAKGFGEAHDFIGKKLLDDQYGIREVLTGKKPIIKNFLIEKDKEWIISWEMRQRIRSYAFLPIPFEDKIEGILRLFSYRENVFTEKHLRMFQSLLRRLGVTIHHIMIMEKLRLTEEELIAEKEHLSVTLRSIADGVIVTDKDGKVVLVNKVAEALTGWTEEEAKGKSVNEVFYIIDEKTRIYGENYIKKILETGDVNNLPDKSILINKDKTERFISDTRAPIRDKSGNIIGMVLVFRDVTEKRKMEEALLNAKKLESIGILAGGIAHDFNNILTAITGNISLAKMLASPQDKIFQRLIEAEKASLRAKGLTHQLLTFSRGGVPVKKTTFLAELIKDSAGFALSGSNVNCKFFFPGDLWLVDIDESQISQVIHNLIINADQAMPKGGTIEVNCENIIVTEQNALPVKNGRYIKISIKDKGMGISKEYLQTIFDPYFTTREKGRGLGLAIVYSIIKNHDGYITLESELGNGTTFIIYIPASELQTMEKNVKTEKIIIGKGRILLMDDEEMVIKTAGEILKKIGYEVEFAGNGTEAVALYKKAKKSGCNFNAVIMDLTVPGGMGGKEAIKILLKIDPNIKVIVSSGYSNDPIMADFRKYGFSGVLAKPYEVNELSELLYKVISDVD